MNVERFLAQRSPGWSELEDLVRRAGGSPDRLGPDGIFRLGALYRQAAADLAAARGSFSDEPFVRRLEELVGRARHLVYGDEGRRATVGHFATTGYWRRVRERPALLVVATLLLLVPALLSGTWATRDPVAASGLVPSEYQSVTTPREPGADLGLAADEQAAFSSQIFTNNIRVTILVFAGGIVFAIPSALVLVYNAVLLGTVAGLAIWAGNGRVAFELVAPHGVLELSCMVVSAVAGFRLGWALIDPGHATRIEALVREARPAVELVLGTAAWLVVAGLVEGFVTPSGLGLETALAVGFGIGALYWGLVWWRGAPEPDAASAPEAVPSQSRARALARR